MKNSRILAFVILTGIVMPVSAFAEKGFDLSVQDLNQDSQRNSSTDLDLRSLRQYKAMHYQQINTGLRTQNLPVISTMSSRICTIDSIIKRFSSSVNEVIVYRGHGHLPKGSDKVGFQFTERAFVSSSLSKSVAIRFSPKDLPVLDVIEILPNVVSSFWVHPYSLIKDEYELLLQRNLKFEVSEIKIEKLAMGRKRIVRHLKVLTTDLEPLIENKLNCQ